MNVSNVLPRRAIRPDDARRKLWLGLGVSIAYVLAARFGFRFAFVAEQVTTVWAPTGIGVAALLLWGRSLWPAIWLGALAANIWTHAPLWTAATVATGNTLEAVAASWTLRRLPRFDPRLRRIGDVFAFIIIAAASSTILSATIGVTALCAAGVQPWGRFTALWRDWWLGDAVGALMVGPVVLTAVTRTSWTRRDWMNLVLFVGGALIATHLVFGQVLGRAGAHHPLEYVIFPFAIAAAVRAGQPITSLVVLGASAVTIWHTVRGAGPFAGPQVHDSLVLLQVFMSVLAGTGLLLAAAIAERETGERRRAAAHAVGDVLAGAHDLTAAAPAILRGICESLEWQMGALWLVGHAEQRLRCLAVWNEAGVAAGIFSAATRDSVFASGIGLPGRVWATGEAAWIEDVGEDDNFPRAAAARGEGIRGAFAFPIRLDSEVLGVIECFHRTALPPDPDLLRTMSTAGHQIGQFMGRQQLLLREAQALREAEAANRAKDEFLATLSHELRTPLNAIVGWTRMLLDGTMDPATARRALEVIDRNAHLQAQLVEDILDVSRIITGGLRLHLSAVDLGTVIGGALDAVRPAADAKRVQLSSRLTPSATVTLADPQRLQQIVWNLLANAVKFTEPGGTVHIELRDEGAHAIRIRVHDDGAGIDPGFLPHVFERFRQADGSASRQHGGLGLGLAIVRHLVELHGGTVQADSAGRGLGATFTVTLPRVDVPLTASDAR